MNGAPAKLLISLSYLVPLGLFFVAWEIASATAIVDPTFLPGLGSILTAFVQLAGSLDFWVNVGATLYTSFMGVLVGLVIGAPLGLFIALSSAADCFFSPLIKLTYALPKTTLIPLLILWFGLGGTTNLIIVAVTSLLPVIVYTSNGARAVPTVMKWSARSLGTSQSGLIWHVLLPATLPSILSSLRIALGFAFVVSIACEMIVSNRGIGKMVFQFGDIGNYRFMFAGLVVIIVIAFLADYLLRKISAHVLRWCEPGAANV